MHMVHRLKGRVKLYRATVEFIMDGKVHKMNSIIIASSIEAAGKLVRGYLKEECPGSQQELVSVKIEVELAITS